MLALLLGIPRHLSWATYARVSSNSRLLPAMQFFIPKAVTVQRWCYSLCILTLPPFKGNSNLIFDLQVQRLQCPSLPGVFEIVCLIVLLYVGQGCQ
jgi:hypothetical protein